MAAESTGSRLVSITTLVAAVGALIGIVTLYFARVDKAIENRPVLMITSAKIVSVGEVIELPEPYRDEKSPDNNLRQVNRAEFEINNRGTRIAGDVEIKLTYMVDIPKDVAPIGDAVSLGDIAPNDTTKQALVERGAISLQVTSRDDPKKTAIGFAFPSSIEGILRYKDKVDPSRIFEEEFCFSLDSDDLKNESTSFSAHEIGKYPVKYSPPKELKRCPPH